MLNIFIMRKPCFARKVCIAIFLQIRDNVKYENYRFYEEAFSEVWKEK